MFAMIVLFRRQVLRREKQSENRSADVSWHIERNTLLRSHPHRFSKGTQQEQNEQIWHQPLAKAESDDRGSGSDQRHVRATVS
jgi:hypothetical protein